MKPDKNTLITELYQYAVFSWMGNPEYLPLTPQEAWDKWVDKELDFEVVSDIVSRVMDSTSDGSTETTTAEYVENTMKPNRHTFLVTLDMFHNFNQNVQMLAQQFQVAYQQGINECEICFDARVIPGMRESLMDKLIARLTERGITDTQFWTSEIQPEKMPLLMQIMAKHGDNISLVTEPILSQEDTDET